MPSALDKPNWGTPPWSIDFRAEETALPDDVDIAIIGGGFTGLAAAACLRHLNPQKSVALFEAQTIGAGASGRTGGLALAGTAAGDRSGLGDVLSGAVKVLQELRISCDLALPGGWELQRNGGFTNSSISWNDSGTLRISRDVAGGTVHAGKLVSGLAQAAQLQGAHIFENVRVEKISFAGGIALSVCGKQVRAGDLLIATNAQSLELSGLSERAEPKFTLALATESLTDAQLEALGLRLGKPFYTVDFPYLWGRSLAPDKVIFGSGLVHLGDWRELSGVDVGRGEAAGLLASLEQRVRGLHPTLRDVRISHRWGGPILVGHDWQPVFMHHPENPHAVVLGAYAGHGVALSVYLGSWAAEALLHRRKLPDWNAA